MGETQSVERLPDAAGGRPAGDVAARLALRLAKDEAGATAVEYGLIVSLIFLVIVGAVSAFGSASTTMYNQISSTIAASV